MRSSKNFPWKTIISKSSPSGVGVLFVSATIVHKCTPTAPTHIPHMQFLERDREREMDGITKVARAYYEGAAEGEKELAHDLFRSLDADGDGKVNYGEFKKLVNPFFANTHVFQELDRNGDGTLDFYEVLAFVYMDKVSIPKCNGCKNLLLDNYFSCLPCQAKTSYYLCCKCYGERKFKHLHSSHEFMDTRAMLKLLDQLLKKSPAISFSRTPAIGIFHNAKAVRLKSTAQDKYLIAAEDEKSVTQDLDGSSKSAEWAVEFVENSDTIIRLKSCYGKYLTASNQRFLSGMTGRKVLQTRPQSLDSSVEWEPIRENGAFKLKTRDGRFLRANGVVWPWKNSVTHDIPLQTATQDWVCWEVHVVETPEAAPPAMVGKEDSFASDSKSASFTPQQVIVQRRLEALASGLTIASSAIAIGAIFAPTYCSIM